MSSGDEVEFQEPNDIQLAIQVIDDGYFERFPNDDYYIRAAVPRELDVVGHPDYEGLILVYVFEEGVRIRRPVKSTEDAMKFMVELEK